MINVIEDWLLLQGLAPSAASLTLSASGIAMVLLLAWVADLVAKKVLLRVVLRLAERTDTDWDDIVTRRRVFHRLAHIAPALVIYFFARSVLQPEEASADADALLTTLVKSGCLLYMVGVVVSVLDGLLNALVDIVRLSKLGKSLPLTTISQVAKLILYGTALIVALSVLLGESPALLFSGLGAMTAVLMLIFQDSILGFVAGIQLSANQMVRPGDWIEMPKYGADGDVLEVALTTVKVQNFDKTITTIPTHALITQSFKNWRGMAESGGRRIKRAINIDIGSVRFCDEQMLDRLSKIDFMREYLAEKQAAITEWNAQHQDDAGSAVHPRRLTNIGTFRAYVVAYLRHHPQIHQDMTFLVRQLPPTPHGVPLEVYVFSRDQNWVRYEGIQSDIFEHLLAMVPEFDLRVYQIP
jgi:miniconductance mechanosensitive channel